MSLKVFVRCLCFLLLLLMLSVAVVPLWHIIVGVVTGMENYLWLLAGAALFIVVRRLPVVKRNEEWLQTTSHEFSHAVVGLMFFHKIHSMVSEERQGVVMHSGTRLGGIFITLAPYCLPVFTYLFVILRMLGAAQSLYVFDILIGFTLAFHVLCFIRQTYPGQPDIKKYGIAFSYLFICVALMLNASIILLSITKGFAGAVSSLAVQYWHTLLSYGEWVMGVFS